MVYRKQKSINDYKANEHFADIFVVRFTKEIRQTRTGKYFFEVKIQDATGDGMLKYWGSKNREDVEEVYNALKPDSVIFAEGTVSEFNGRTDFSVNAGKLRVLAKEEYSIGDFIRKSERNAEEMYSELKKHIDSVQDRDLKLVLAEFFEDPEFVEEFKKAPGAMHIHHGWESGLLEHTLSVANTCAEVARNHPGLDRDLLITGAVLHDIGKIDELTVSAQIKITDKGNLLGHMVIGVQRLTRVLDKLDIPEVTKDKLVHIMLSHHGRVENGCPKPPMIPEALAIARADELDANLATMLDVKKNTQTNDSFAYNKHAGQVYIK